MKNIPDMLFVIDTNKESIAIKEAKKIGIPVVAILDTNSSTDGVDFPIPGNDDASRAISLYCDLVSKTILDGMESQLGSAGIDLGESETPETGEIVDEKDISTSKDSDEGLPKIDDNETDANREESLKLEETADEKAKIKSEEVKEASDVSENDI